jgi:hypothetical protein
LNFFSSIINPYKYISRAQDFNFCIRLLINFIIDEKEKHMKMSPMQ